MYTYMYLWACVYIDTLKNFCMHLCTSHICSNIQMYITLPLELIYVNLQRLKTGDIGKTIQCLLQILDCMYKVGRLDLVFSGCFHFYSLFLTLKLRGRLEAGVVWGHGGPACWCWTAVFLWMLWISQRWWRRKPLKNRQRKHWVLQILAAQMWCWHGSICGLVVRASERWVKNVSGDSYDRTS